MNRPLAVLVAVATLLLLIVLACAKPAPAPVVHAVWSPPMAPAQLAQLLNLRLARDSMARPQAEEGYPDCYYAKNGNPLGVCIEAEPSVKWWSSCDGDMPAPIPNVPEGWIAGWFAYLICTTYHQT